MGLPHDRPEELSSSPSSSPDPLATTATGAADDEDKDKDKEEDGSIFDVVEEEEEGGDVLISPPSLGLLLLLPVVVVVEMSIAVSSESFKGSGPYGFMGVSNICCSSRMHCRSRPGFSMSCGGKMKRCLKQRDMRFSTMKAGRL